MRNKKGKRWDVREKMSVELFTELFSSSKLTTSKKQNELIIENDPAVKRLSVLLNRGHGATIIKVSICAYNLGYPIRKWGNFKL